MEPARDPANEHVHKKYYAFRRLDTAKWNRFKFWAFAATVFIPKAIIGVLIIFFTAVLTKIITLGIIITEEKPLSGWRSKAVTTLVYYASSAILITAGQSSHVKQADFDYTYYLGPSYKE